MHPRFPGLSHGRSSRRAQSKRGGPKPATPPRTLCYRTLAHFFDCLATIRTQHASWQCMAGESRQYRVASGHCLLAWHPKSNVILNPSLRSRVNYVKGLLYTADTQTRHRPALVGEQWVGSHSCKCVNARLDPILFV